MMEDRWPIGLQKPRLADFLRVLPTGSGAVSEKQRWELSSILPPNRDLLVPKALLLCPARGREAPGPPWAEMYIPRPHRFPKDAEGPLKGPGVTTITEQPQYPSAPPAPGAVHRAGACAHARRGLLPMGW